ncbi:MAG: hypothetical protein IJL20_10650 [Lachnospiraceae bacterium]|nr:hypothetical protein [Lachnospiraceae bacterium]
MNKKMQPEDYEYYQEDYDMMEYSPKDTMQISSERFNEIIKIAAEDIEVKREKRKKEEFNSDSEYNFYLLVLYLRAIYLERKFELKE